MNTPAVDFIRVHNVDVRGDWWHLGAYLDVTDAQGGLYTFWLDPGQCRALHRAGARALGYGHIKRQSRQRENTWKMKVEQESEMLTKMANLLFPKPRVSKK